LINLFIASNNPKNRSKPQNQPKPENLPTIDLLLGQGEGKTTPM